jgi:hypothetical protein
MVKTFTKDEVELSAIQKKKYKKVQMEHITRSRKLQSRINSKNTPNEATSPVF